MVADCASDLDLSWGNWLTTYVVLAENETIGAFRDHILNSKSNALIERQNDKLANMCMEKQEMTMREHVQSGQRRKIPSYDLSILIVRHTSLRVQEGIYAVDNFQLLLNELYRF